MANPESKSFGESYIEEYLIKDQSEYSGFGYRMFDIGIPIDETVKAIEAVAKESGAKVNNLQLETGIVYFSKLLTVEAINKIIAPIVLEGK